MSAKRYRYRIYPEPGQQASLSRLFGCVRVVFNDFIAARRHQRENNLPFEHAKVLETRLLTEAKLTDARAWLTEVSATPLQQALRDADQAYRNFFDSVSGKRKGRRVGAPRFRSRHDSRQTARFTKAARFKIAGGWENTNPDGGRLKLPKVGWVKVEWSRPLPSDPSSVTVVREADGHYYASFVVDVPAAEHVEPTHDRTAGIDVGLTSFAAIVYSDGTRETIANPRYFKARARKLARAQRALARKQKGSKNRTKARVQVAVQHRKVREARLNFHHELAARLVRENQAVAMEQLNVVGLARAGATGARGRGHRRSVHDVGWGQFANLLAEKGNEHGRLIVPVNPAYSSQTCSVCGVLDGPKPLNVREWVCKGGCGALLDRDYNAAVNIMVAAGLALSEPRETLNACGPDGRLRLAGAVGDEAGTHRTVAPPKVA